MKEKTIFVIITREHLEEGFTQVKIRFRTKTKAKHNGQ